MAHFALLWKARTIEKYRYIYEQEKINSIITSKVGTPNKSWYQRFKHYKYDTKRRAGKIFRRWFPDGTPVSNFVLYLKTDQTFPNFVLKSILGFVGGIVLTYLCFMFFIFQLSISLVHATIMSSIIGVLLTLGLAFSYRVRCLVFLLFPQFFSKVGRYTLTCYALVLILTGPATNTLRNSEVLSESMACGQEQVKTSVKQITESIRKPFNSMKDTIKKMIEEVKQVAVKLKETLLKVHRLVMSIVRVLQSAFSWLSSIVSMCNKKVGTPYDRCTRSLEDGVLDCRARLGPYFAWLCHVAHVASVACVAVKPLDLICVLVEFVSGTIVATVRRKLRTFSNHVKTMLYVTVHVHHSYSFSSNSSRSASQVAAGIVTEIRHRAEPLLTWLSWSSCVTSLFLLLIIFRAKYYQHMYETRSRYDNRYVTKELRDLDLKRARESRDTVLPLNRRERAKYVTTTSFRLVASEKLYLTRSIVFMGITTFKLLVHMVADYSLYWVLMTLRFYGRFQSPQLPGAPDAGVQISGAGPVAGIVRSLVDSLAMPLTTPAPTLSACLPDPYPPDMQRYTQIGVLIFLLWFFALFEPYGLRLRHVIMALYRPERAKARAVWLYNHILRTRGGFLKLARRKLHRDFKYSTEAKFTFRQWLDAHIPYWWLRSLLGTTPKDPHCLLCGTSEKYNDEDTTLIRCETPDCPGVYCTSCFSDIGQLCTICLSPIDYGDISDVSLEKGSSEESSLDKDETDTEESQSEMEVFQRTQMPNIKSTSNRSPQEGQRKNNDKPQSSNEKNGKTKDDKTLQLNENKQLEKNYTLQDRGQEQSDAIHNENDSDTNQINKKKRNNRKIIQVKLRNRKNHKRNIGFQKLGSHMIKLIRFTRKFSKYIFPSVYYKIERNPLNITISKVIRRKHLLKRSRMKLVCSHCKNKFNVNDIKKYNKLVKNNDSLVCTNRRCNPNCCFKSFVNFKTTIKSKSNVPQSNRLNIVIDSNNNTQAQATNSYQVLNYEMNNDWIKEQYNKEVGIDSNVNDKSKPLIQETKNEIKLMPNKYKVKFKEPKQKKLAKEEISNQNNVKEPDNRGKFLYWHNAPKPLRCACPITSCCCIGNYLEDSKNVPLKSRPKIGYWYKLIGYTNKSQAVNVEYSLKAKLESALSDEIKKYKERENEGNLAVFGPEDCLTRCPRFYRVRTADVGVSDDNDNALRTKSDEEKYIRDLRKSLEKVRKDLWKMHQIIDDSSLHDNLPNKLGITQSQVKRRDDVDDSAAGVPKKLSLSRASALEQNTTKSQVKSREHLDKSGAVLKKPLPRTSNQHKNTSKNKRKSSNKKKDIVSFPFKQKLDDAIFRDLSGRRLHVAPMMRQGSNPFHKASAVNRFKRRFCSVKDNLSWLLFGPHFDTVYEEKVNEVKTFDTRSCQVNEEPADKPEFANTKPPELTSGIEKKKDGSDDTSGSSKKAEKIEGPAFSSTPIHADRHVKDEATDTLPELRPIEQKEHRSSHRKSRANSATRDQNEVPGADENVIRPMERKKNKQKYDKKSFSMQFNTEQKEQERPEKDHSVRPPERPLVDGSSSKKSFGMQAPSLSQIENENPVKDNVNRSLERKRSKGSLRKQSFGMQAPSPCQTVKEIPVKDNANRSLEGKYCKEFCSKKSFGMQVPSQTEAQREKPVKDKDNRSPSPKEKEDVVNQDSKYQQTTPYDNCCKSLVRIRMPNPKVKVINQDCRYKKMIPCDNCCNCSLQVMNPKKTNIKCCDNKEHGVQIFSAHRAGVGIPVKNKLSRPQGLRKDIQIVQLVPADQQTSPHGIDRKEVQTLKKYKNWSTKGSTENECELTTCNFENFSEQRATNQNSRESIYDTIIDMPSSSSNSEDEHMQTERNDPRAKHLSQIRDINVPIEISRDGATPLYKTEKLDENMSSSNRSSDWWSPLPVRKNNSDSFHKNLSVPFLVKRTNSDTFSRNSSIPIQIKKDNGSCTLCRNSSITTPFEGGINSDLLSNSDDITWERKLAQEKNDKTYLSIRNIHSPYNKVFQK